MYILELPVHVKETCVSLVRLHHGEKCLSKGEVYLKTRSEHHPGNAWLGGTNYFSSWRVRTTTSTFSSFQTTKEKTPSQGFWNRSIISQDFRICAEKNVG